MFLRRSARDNARMSGLSGSCRIDNAASDQIDLVHVVSLGQCAGEINDV